MKECVHSDVHVCAHACNHAWFVYRLDDNCVSHVANHHERAHAWQCIGAKRFVGMPLCMAMHPYAIMYVCIHDCACGWLADWLVG